MNAQSSGVRAALLALLSLGALAGCLELPDFPSAAIVEGPRVIAIIADPPEVGPSQNGLRMTVLVAEAERFEVAFEVCGALDTMFGGSQFGEMDEEDCRGSRALFSQTIESEPSASEASGLAHAVLNIPPEVIAALWANRELAATILGDTLPRETLERVLSSVGVPVLVEATVIVDGRRLRAVKRVLFSENPEPHRNPPPPEADFAGARIRTFDAEPWTCAREDGHRLRVRAGASAVIAPLTAGDSEPWTERYKVINARGELEERIERAFYSWYGTGGSFEQQVTRAPLRNQVWTAPREPGEYRLWLIVRDGHGGASACGMTVDVSG